MVIKTYTARSPADESLVSTSGFMLGVLGGLLDFASATSIAIDQGGSGMMNGYLLSPDAWAVLLVALGILVVAVAVLSVTSTGVMHLKGFSVLMVLLGILNVRGLYPGGVHNLQLRDGGRGSADGH
jgi:hypothetical protein